MLKKIFEEANKFISDNKLSGIIISFISFIFIIIFSFSNTYERFNLNLYDLNLIVKPSINIWDDLTFLDIDENSINSIGKFPWPRNEYVKGLQLLHEIGAIHSTLDIMFPNKSPLQVNHKIFNELSNNIKAKADINSEEFNKILVNNDKIFANGIKDKNVILSYTFNADKLTENIIEYRKSKKFLLAKEKFLKKSSLKISKEELKNYESFIEKDIQSLSYPIPELMSIGYAFGFVNRDLDIDGAVRKVRMVRFFQGRLFFNLSVIMLIKAANLELKDVSVVLGEKIVLNNAFNPMTGETKDIIIPIDDNGMMYLNWAGDGERGSSFKLIPYDVLNEYHLHSNSVSDVFDEEDQYKIGKEAELINKLADIKEELKEIKDNDILISMKAGEKELKKELEIITKNKPLAELQIELENNLSKFKSEKNIKIKKDIWLKIISIRKGIIKTQEEYKNNYLTEINKIKIELKKNDDSTLKKELVNLEYMYNQINLINRVDSLSGNLTISGLTAAGTIDIGQTPLSKAYPMVGVYVNTINTIVNDEFIIVSNKWINYFLILIVALVMGFFVQRFNAQKSLITIVLSFFALNLFVTLLFVFFNIWLDQIGLALALLLPSISITAVKFVNEEGQKRFIKNAFSRYLTPDVIDEIIKNPDALQLGGENREITIFFSDVAGFSTISEKLSPTELVELLNEYLSEMTDIILSYGGTVDKYEGDAIMAFYGAPKPYEDHAERACLAAIDMKKKLREMQENWKKEGRDALYVRMGMNSGQAVVGNMGSKIRMDYTAMGDSVNLAARLEGANKFYKTGAMISEYTYNATKTSIETRKLDTIRVIGKSEAIVIYELLGKKGKLPDRVVEMREEYSKGLEAFRGRDWKKARGFFKSALKIIDDDGPSQTYYDRCTAFMKKPPTKKWDGVYSLKSK